MPKVSKENQKKIEDFKNQRSQKVGDAVEGLWDLIKPKKKKKKTPKKVDPNSPLGKAASSIRKERDKYRD